MFISCPMPPDLGISAFAAANIMSVIGGSHVAGKIGMGGICDKNRQQRPSLIISFSIIVASMFLVTGRLKRHGYSTCFAIIFGFAYGGIPAWFHLQ